MESQQQVPYAHGRVYHDADAHIVETPDWLVAHADPGVRERLRPLFVSSVKPGEDRLIDKVRARHRDPADRPRALDLLGFSSQRPSAYVKRQIRVTPYPVEPVGWIVEQVGPEICMFSSDWPHVEGGRNPIKRFEASMAGLDEAALQRFYCDNFVDLMGRGLAA